MGMTCHTSSMTHQQVAIRNRMVTEPYRVAVEMQRLLADDVRSPDTRPSDRAKCVLAWDKLEDRKRILKGKPLPGSQRPEKPKDIRQRHVSDGWQEPTVEPDAPEGIFFSTEPSPHPHPPSPGSGNK